jgi:hypothetical protein
MTLNEIARVQEYLRHTFSNNRIAIRPPAKPKAPVEVCIGDEFIGVLHRDEDEGEISYSLNISILEEDLPPAVPI